MLVPPDLPLYRRRPERFDDLVVDVVEHLEPRWGADLARIEFAVEDVPLVYGSSGADPTDAFDDDVISDGDIPLARVIRPDSEAPGSGAGPAERQRRDPSTGGNGRARAKPGSADSASAPRIVLYRRPLETRARDAHDLAHLVHDVVVEQVAHVLGISPDELDDPNH